MICMQINKKDKKKNSLNVYKSTIIINVLEVLYIVQHSKDNTKRTIFRKIQTRKQLSKSQVLPFQRYFVKVWF